MTSQTGRDDLLMHEPGLAIPGTLTIDPSMAVTQAAATVRAAQAFYGFWNSGSENLLAVSVTDGFHDHTLPEGRPQGPEGPAVASRAFRAAVPDLSSELEELLVTGDRVTARLRFTGSFTGTFKGIRGNGQAVDFIAIDILRVRDGRVTDNWHLEDNLTLLMQLGAVRPVEGE